ncbi:MAG: hypothetical protein IPL61_15990 [Myxococcales bacterium]|nr:hypothetical protein [Myxococcales bacterium]
MTARAAALALALTACAAPAADPPRITIDDAIATRSLAGTWTWALTTTADGTTRTERERWDLAITGDWLRLAGRYQRTVDVRAVDGVPFTCVQAPSYRLASTVDVTVAAAPGGAVIEEVGYQVEPSPCDRGLRRLARYQARLLDDDTLELRWADGVAHLQRATPPTPPPRLAVAAAPAGPWRWTATSWTAGGLVQREDERWELALGDDGALAGWYVRTVEVRDPGGAIVPCAGAPGYRFVDRYLVRGHRRPAAPDDDDAGDGWRFDEVAVVAGAHPCLAASPTRAKDGAELVVIGDVVVLTWRGARRQVLRRPAAYSPSEYAGL